jgi:hypothetical protein
MTKYEELMNKSDSFCLKAIKCYQVGENDLAVFYKNASNVYKERARNLGEVNEMAKENKEGRTMKNLVKIVQK